MILRRVLIFYKIICAFIKVSVKTLEFKLFYVLMSILKWLLGKDGSIKAIFQMTR